MAANNTLLPSNTSWPPHVTVAVVVERNKEYLFVEETDAGETVFNQPAGHVEFGETIFAAALRETLEETGWEVELKGLIGVYQYYSEHNNTTYLRICFAAQPLRQVSNSLDADIIAAHWFEASQVETLPLRSPLVLKCLQDAQHKPLLPLDSICHV